LSSKRSNLIDVRPGVGADLWAEASHDLRQPVQAMLLLVSMLDAGDGTLRKDVAGWLGASLNALHGMFEAITLLARIESGTRRPEVVSLDLVALGAQRAARLSAEVARDIVCRGEPVPIASDEKLVTQICDAMLLAGLKLGEGPLLLEVAGNAGISVRVSYRGRAPSPKQWSGTFEEAARSGVAGHPVLGLGLGFARRMAAAIGADLRCEPRNSGEQQFVLALPPSR
jgi:signal transduction histidine kinase